MKYILFSLIVFVFTISAYSIEKYEDLTLVKNIITNDSSIKNEKNIKFRYLDVPTIYEIRNLNLVESKICMTNFISDVILKKLLPQKIMSSDDKFEKETVFTKYDTKDIIINEIGVNNKIYINNDNTINTISINNNIFEFHPIIIRDLIDEYGKMIWYTPNIINDMNIYWIYLKDQLPSIKDCISNKMYVHSYNINDINNIQNIDIKTIQVNVNESVYEYLDNLKEETKFNEDYVKYNNSEYLKDLYSLSQYDRRNWIDVLKRNRKSEIKYIKPTKNRKIISEIRYVENYDEDLMNYNLSFLKSMGYDSVLVRFDTTEPLTEMKKLIQKITDLGFSIYLTYVGLDNQKPRWNPFCSQYRLEFFLQELCPLAEGMFLNWRSTSAHVKLLPIEFFNYLCNTARYYNNNIIIYGEIFYGRIDYIKKTKVVITYPDNVSGILINNMGYVGYNHAYIVNKLFEKTLKNYNNVYKVCQVIGYSPYYCSKMNLNLSLDEEYKFKNQVESKFRRLECSTLTFLHDGVDDNYVIEKVYDTDDNILTDKKIFNFNNDKYIRGKNK